MSIEYPLEPPDTFHLDAVRGWLGLGDLQEAREELKKVGSHLQRHPEVLKVRWEVDAAARNWGGALEIAAALVRVEPEDPLGWIHRSYALHELGRTGEARDNLLRVVDRFPVSPILPYNLACYECQLGRMEQAKQWLERAFKLGNPKQMRSMAFKDPDLKPLWPELRTS